MWYFNGAPKGSILSESSPCLAFRSLYIGIFPLTVTVTTRGNRNYNSPLIRPPLRTVTGRGDDPTYASIPGRAAQFLTAWGSVSYSRFKSKKYGTSLSAKQQRFCGRLRAGFKRKFSAKSSGTSTKKSKTLCPSYLQISLVPRKNTIEYYYYPGGLLS